MIAQINRMDEPAITADFLAAMALPGGDQEEPAWKPPTKRQWLALALEILPSIEAAGTILFKVDEELKASASRVPDLIATMAVELESAETLLRNLETALRISRERLVLALSAEEQP